MVLGSGVHNYAHRTSLHALANTLCGSASPLSQNEFPKEAAAKRKAALSDDHSQTAASQHERTAAPARKLQETRTVSQYEPCAVKLAVRSESIGNPHNVLFTVQT